MKQWVVSGAVHKLTDVRSHVKHLKNEIYEVTHNPHTGEVYLLHNKESFAFPYTVYGYEKTFIDRTVKSYRNTTSNLGIILTGLQGTGKSVTAKQLCNAFEIPVFLITYNVPNLVDFINSIEEPVVIFIDEFEKIYDKDDGSLLTLMDGVLTTKFNHVFLMTTNKMNVNEYLLQRPSRVMYIKKYGNLVPEVIVEIVDDLLKHKNRREEVISFIASLELITMDIVKSVIHECNVHDESPEDFKQYFNVVQMSPRFSVSKYNDETAAFDFFAVNASVTPNKFNKDAIGYQLRVDGGYEGMIKHISGDEITVEGKAYNSVLDREIPVTKVFRVREDKFRHSNFKDFEL